MRQILKKECLYVGLVNKKIHNLEEIKQFILSIPACINSKLYTEIGNVFFTTHSDNIWFQVGKNNNSKPNIDLCEKHRSFYCICTKERNCY